MPAEPPNTPNRPRYKIIVPAGVAPKPVRTQTSLHAWVGPTWGLCGFILGAAVWHTLGFWDFVGKTVLRGDEEERRMARLEGPPGPPAMRTTASVHGPKQIVAGYSPAAAKALRACSNAAPSAEGDDTTVTACPPGTPVAPSTRQAKKSDFGALDQPSATSWGIVTVRTP